MIIVMTRYPSPLVQDLIDFELQPLVLDKPAQAWRWRSYHSREWNRVENDSHAELLIRCVDDQWVWLTIAKGSPESGETFAQVHTDDSGGMIVELNAYDGVVTRVTRRHNQKDIFTAEEAIPIFLQWMKSRSMASEFYLKNMDV